MPGLGNNSDHSLISAATASTDVAARVCRGICIGVVREQALGEMFLHLLYPRLCLGFSLSTESFTLTALGVTISSPVPPLESRLHYN